MINKNILITISESYDGFGISIGDEKSFWFSQEEDVKEKLENVFLELGFTNVKTEDCY